MFKNIDDNILEAFHIYKHCNDRKAPAEPLDGGAFAVLLNTKYTTQSEKTKVESIYRISPYRTTKIPSSSNYTIRRLGTCNTQSVHRMRLMDIEPQVKIAEVSTDDTQKNPDALATEEGARIFWHVRTPNAARPRSPKSQSTPHFSIRNRRRWPTAHRNRLIQQQGANASYTAQSDHTMTSSHSHHLHQSNQHTPADVTKSPGMPTISTHDVQASQFHNNDATTQQTRSTQPPFPYQPIKNFWAQQHITNCSHPAYTTWSQYPWHYSPDGTRTSKRQIQTLIPKQLCSKNTWRQFDASIEQHTTSRRVQSH